MTFLWLLFAVLCVSFTSLASANEGERNEYRDSTKTDAAEDYDYYYDYPDYPDYPAKDELKIPEGDAAKDNLVTNSTMEEDDDYYDDYADLENELKGFQGASQEMTLDPISFECGKSGSSRILTQLNRGKIDPEQLSMDELMAYTCETDILDCLHIVDNVKALKKLASVLPVTALGAITARPGLVEQLPVDTIIIFASVPNVANAANINILLDVANRRPLIIGKAHQFFSVYCLGHMLLPVSLLHAKIQSYAEKLPVDVLDMFIKMPLYIDGLSDTTKSKLIHSKMLAEKLSLLPKSTLVSIVVKNTDILKTLPKNKVKLNAWLLLMVCGC